VKQISTIGLDLAKNVFQIHGADARARRSSIGTASSRGPALFEKLPPCLVGLEAWRRFALLGARDRGARSRRALDSSSLCEAVRKTRKDRRCRRRGDQRSRDRKTMRFVPIKSADQQAAVMVLKTRTLLVRQQTQAINALRGHLSELGVIAGVGVTKVKALIEIVRDEADDCLPKAARLALTEIADQIEALTRQIDKLERGSSPRRSATRTCGC